jgi:hypothetical protein
MYKLLLKGGLLNVINLLVALILQYLMVRLLSESDIKKYVQITSIVSWAPLILIALYNYAIVNIKQYSGKLVTLILVFQSIFVFLLCIYFYFSDYTLSLIKLMYTTAIIVSFDWLCQALGLNNILIGVKIISRLIFLLTLLVFYYFSFYFSFDLFLLINTAAIFLETLIYLFYIKGSIQFENIIKRDLNWVTYLLSLIPFYAVHGQSYNYILFFSDTLNAGDLLFVKFIYVLLNLVTSLTFFTFSFFSGPVNSKLKYFYKGLIISFVSSIVIAAGILLILPYINNFLFFQHRYSHSILLVGLFIIIVYPIINYYVVNFFISQNKYSHIFPGLLLSSLLLIAVSVIFKNIILAIYLSHIFLIAYLFVYQFFYAKSSLFN